MTTLRLAITMFLTGAVAVRFTDAVNAYKGTRKDVFRLLETALEVLALGFVFRNF